MSTGDQGASSEVVRLDGHVVDSLLLPKVLDAIVDAGASYEILELEMGTTALDPESRADPGQRRRRVGSRRPAGRRAGPRGQPGGRLGRRAGAGTGRRRAARRVLLHHQPGHLGAGGRALDTRAGAPRWTAPSSSTPPRRRHRQGCGWCRCTGSGPATPVVVGWRGVRVETPTRADDAEGFGFMTSEVSSEKPKAVSLARVAASIRDARDRRQRGTGGRVLAVCGPAVVHTGAAPALARLVRDGWVQVLFAGNGFATHDIESNVLGTSLGVSLGEGVLSEHGHANHLRVINEVRRFGSIAAAVEAGWLARRRPLRMRPGGGALRARRVGARRRTSPRRDLRHRGRRRRHAGAARRRRRGRDAGHHAARHRHRQPPAGRRGDLLRRHQPGGRHQARRSRQPPGPRHRHRRGTVHGGAGRPPVRCRAR